MNLERFFNLVTHYPKRVLAISFLVIAMLTAGMGHLSISNDFRVYLSKDNPQLQAFEEFENNYVKSDSATLVVTAKQGDVFTRRGLELIESLTAEAWLLDYAYRVSSITNYIHSYAQDDEIFSDYLVQDAAELSDSEINKVREIALSESRLLQSLIAPDGKVSVIFISLNLPDDQANASIQVTELVESLRDKYRQIYPGFHIDNGGSTAFNTTLARAVGRDMSTLLPLSYIIIFSGLFLFLRSFYGAASIFILITVCLVSTFGFFGWVSPVLTPIAGFAPSILLSIMVADSVHVLVSYFHNLREGQVKKRAIIESLKLNFMPILITSVTTMIGFLSLNFSASPPYRDLGNMVAFGVLIALIFSLTLLPAMMMLLPTGKVTERSPSTFFQSFSGWVINYRKHLILVMTTFTILLVSFIPQNKVSDNWANYFDDSFELIQLVQRLDGYLTGINALEYSLKPSEGESIYSQSYLEQVDRFHQWFKVQEKTVDVKSFSELMKDLNQVMHGDNQQHYRLPESPALAAQYLLFYEFGLPEGLGLNNLVTMHKDATRFSVSVTDAGSDELLKIDNAARLWLAQNAPAIEPTQATGLGVVFAHIAQRNITSLLLGTLIALFGISVILVIIFKSLKYGLISLIPNLIPAALAYGFWGATYGYVDISLSIVACATLGIVVDDTVHFLHKYIRARKLGLTTEQAVRDSFNRVGIALLTTSMVLASGFLILATSPMNTSATIGLLMAITLIFALIVDFLLLPPLLLLWDKDTDSQS